MSNVVPTTSIPSLHQLWRHGVSSSTGPSNVNVSFNVLRCNFAQVQMLTSSSRHAILVFIIPILVNLIEIKYQGKCITPFQAHPVTTMVATTSLLVYCLAYGAERAFHSSTYAYVFQSLMTFASSISLASLASLIFPESIRCFLYTFFIVLSMVELSGIVLEFCHWIHQILTERFLNVWVCTHPLQYPRSRRERPLLPETFMDVNHMLQI